MQSPKHYLMEDGTPLDHYVVSRENQSILCWSESARIPSVVLIEDDRLFDRCRAFLENSGRVIENISQWKTYVRARKWPGSPTKGDVDTGMIPEEHLLELKRRIADADANPDAGIPLAEWKAKLAAD